MRTYILILLFFFSFFFNNYIFAQSTYEAYLTKCLENATKREFIHAKTKKKGYGYSNLPPASCLIGATLPDFFTKAMDNSNVSTKQLAGKVSIINFWFIKCRPCIEEIPTLNELVVKYGREEVNFIGFTRDDRTQLTNFFERQPFHFTIIPNSIKQLDQKFKNLWGYPLTIITNKENIIIEVISGKDTKGHSLDWLSDKITLTLEKEAIYPKD